MLDQKTIDLVKGTAPILKENGTELAKHFYKIMFANNPEVKPFFDMSKQESGEQPKALAMAVFAAASNIDNLEAILPAVSKIAERHVELKIMPEHYPIVGANLLQAIKDVLNADDELIDAWAKAYSVISDVFIATEKDLYSKV